MVYKDLSPTLREIDEERKQDLDKREMALNKRESGLAQLKVQRQSLRDRLKSPLQVLREKRTAQIIYPKEKKRFEQELYETKHPILSKLRKKLYSKKPISNYRYKSQSMPKSKRRYQPPTYVNYNPQSENKYERELGFQQQQLARLQGKENANTMPKNYYQKLDRIKQQQRLLKQQTQQKTNLMGASFLPSPVNLMGIKMPTASMQLVGSSNILGIKFSGKDDSGNLMRAKLPFW